MVRGKQNALNGIFAAIVIVVSAASTQIVLAQTLSAERIESVGRLVENSSAARMVRSSGDANAIKKHDQALTWYRQSRDAYQANNSELAEELLAKATRAMMDAARMVKGDGRTMVKEEHDFDERLASVDALVAAYDRIVVEEQHSDASPQETRNYIEGRIAEAKRLRQRDVPRAREVLEQAYLSAKIAIERVRGGTTLVRSLSFASKEDEYRYEIDRNDTHRMLVDVLLREKLSLASGTLSQRVDDFMTRAADLRSRAEGQAADGAYGDAVQTLELSTKAIVRAIRSAGVYIPG